MSAGHEHNEPAPALGIELEEVVPWGRALREYRHMFRLDDRDLKTQRFVDCGAGPASFNAQVTAMGGRVVSVDPIYRFSPKQIERRIHETHHLVVEKTSEKLEGYHWEDVKSPQELGERRMAAMERFLRDFPDGIREGRYVEASLPEVPFKDDSFDMALCSHLLFTYSEQLGLSFHLKTILEMMRVAPEARIFPLVQLDCRPSPCLEPVERALREKGFLLSREPSEYRMQKGADNFLRIRRG